MTTESQKENKMPKFLIILKYFGKQTNLTTDSVADAYEHLDTCIHSIPSTEIVHIKAFEFNGRAVSGLNDAFATKYEIIALKNAIDGKDDAELFRILGAINTFSEPTGLNIDELLKAKLSLVKQAIISKSHIQAKEAHFEEVKGEIIMDMFWNEGKVKNPLHAELIQQIKDSIDWDKVKRKYFGRVEVDYFGDAVLFIQKETNNTVVDEIAV